MVTLATQAMAGPDLHLKGIGGGGGGGGGTFEGLTMNVEFCQDNSADQRNSQFPKT